MLPTTQNFIAYLCLWTKTGSFHTISNFTLPIHLTQSFTKLYLIYKFQDFTKPKIFKSAVGIHHGSDQDNSTKV